VRLLCLDVFLSATAERGHGDAARERVLDQCRALFMTSKFRRTRSTKSAHEKTIRNLIQISGAGVIGSDDDGAGSRIRRCAPVNAEDSEIMSSVTVPVPCASPINRVISAGVLGSILRVAAATSTVKER
jgi:hypothetical protein